MKEFKIGQKYLVTAPGTEFGNTIKIIGIVNSCEVYYETVPRKEIAHGSFVSGSRFADDLVLAEDAEQPEEQSDKKSTFESLHKVVTVMEKYVDLINLMETLGQKERKLLIQALESALEENNGKEN